MAILTEEQEDEIIRELWTRDTKKEEKEKK